MLSQVRRHNPSLNDAYFISSFISGLKDYIQSPLQCHRPTSLSQAYWYAKRLENPNPYLKKSTQSNPFPRQHKPWVKDREIVEEKENKPQPTIAELKAAGKCFKCKELGVPAHIKVCKGKHIYSLVLV
jgi:hypothetical protein